MCRGPGIAALAHLLIGCPGPPAARPTHPQDVALIVVDTLRADRVGATGGSARLDRLGMRGTAFPNAFAQAPRTGASVASLMPSPYQTEHGIVSMKRMLRDGELTLAEVLHDHGYATAGSTANVTIGTTFGVVQGFDRYETFPLVSGPSARSRNIPARADAVLNAAAAWIAKRERAGDAPVFVFVQLMETHILYAPPESALARVFPGRTPPDVDEASTVALLANLYPPTPQLTARLEGIYDAEVVAVDDALQRFYVTLGARGHLSDAVVVVTADHDEAFGEHTLFGHEHIHVPLIVARPGDCGGVAVDDSVQLVDVAPTLLELADVPRPATFEGRSFRNLLGDRRPRGRLRRLAAGAHGSWSGPQGLAYTSTKAIADSEGRTEFHDLGRHPLEQHAGDLAPAAQARLRRALEEIPARLAAKATVSPVVLLNDQRRERLRALGYVE